MYRLKQKFKKNMAYLYKRMRKQYSIDNGVSWIDSDPPEYIVGELIDANSDCIPDEMYRWVDVEFDSANSNTYICQGTDLYSIQKEQISEDGGKTWNDVVPITTQIGELIQENVKLCGGDDPLYLYRWIDVEFDSANSNTYICENETLYSIQKQQFSEDGGKTWNDVVPINIRPNQIIENSSELCGGFNFKGNFSGVISYPFNTEEFYYYNCSGDDVSSNDCIRKKFNSYNCTGVDLKYKECFFDETINETLEGQIHINLLNQYNSYVHLVNYPDTQNLKDLSFEGQSRMISCEATLNMNTSNITDMGAMFRGCSSLENLNLSSFDTSNVTNMDNMFDGCLSLENLNLSSFDTSNVNSMIRMFDGCSNLISLDLNNFDTSNVTDMQYMFYGCKTLENLNLSSFDTSNVTNMRGMFSLCGFVITSLDLSNFNMDKVENFSEMFEGSMFLEIKLPNVNIDRVVSFWQGFNLCHNLLELNLENFKVKIDKDTFNSFLISSVDTKSGNHSKLKKLNLSGLDISEINFSEIASSENFNCGMFCENLFNLEEINITGWNLDEFKGYLLFSPKSNLKKIYCYGASPKTKQKILDSLIYADLDDMVEIIT